MKNDDFWQNKKVFITGHTGFKGSWLSLLLYSLGAEVVGYALKPPTYPSLYELCNIDELVDSIVGDVRDRHALERAILENEPDIVIHMAAQPLVRDSYKHPVETYSTNIMGTVYLFEAIRKCKTTKVIVNVTTDKCYENQEWIWGYREYEPMGGYDPYSSSKACSELITSAYRKSFFHPKDYKKHGVALASARAGNVIGGGDWASDRLMADCMRALLNKEKIVIRYPNAIRPWQHVLEPLSGYLKLAHKLYIEGCNFSEAWNFGPDDNDAKSVEWIVNKICKKWGDLATYTIEKGNHPHEARYLKLDCSKAKNRLNWYPRWNLDQALDKVIEWTKAFKNNEDLKTICLNQIADYIG